MSKKKPFIFKFKETPSSQEREVRIMADHWQDAYYSGIEKYQKMYPDLVVSSKPVRPAQPTQEPLPISPPPRKIEEATTGNCLGMALALIIGSASLVSFTIYLISKIA